MPCIDHDVYATILQCAFYIQYIITVCSNLSSTRKSIMYLCYYSSVVGCHGEVGYEGRERYLHGEGGLVIVRVPVPNLAVDDNSREPSGDVRLDLHTGDGGNQSRPGDVTRVAMTSGVVVPTSSGDKRQAMISERYCRQMTTNQYREVLQHGEDS
jgi:hypothetical protein